MEYDIHIPCMVTDTRENVAYSIHVAKENQIRLPLRINNLTQNSLAISAQKEITSLTV